VSLGVIMTNTEIKFHILLFTLSSSSVSQSLSFNLLQSLYCPYIRKYFVHNGEWTLHPTKRGVNLSLNQRKELKKNIPLFEDRGPELRTMDNKVTGED
jgi:hypothetical protein